MVNINELTLENLELNEKLKSSHKYFDMKLYFSHFVLHEYL